MRARLALCFAGIIYEHREIELKNKPHSMLEYSPKGTVPVFIDSEGKVIDESLDIILYALKHNDSKNMLPTGTIYTQSIDLIKRNDTEFKQSLDRYKYPSRYGLDDSSLPRQACEQFLRFIDDLLQSNTYILTTELQLIDIAIFPFVRQCIKVDNEWFLGLNLLQLSKWLDKIGSIPEFTMIMKKYPIWHPEAKPIIQNWAKN